MNWSFFSKWGSGCSARLCSSARERDRRIFEPKPAASERSQGEVHKKWKEDKTAEPILALGSGVGTARPQVFSARHSNRGRAVPAPKGC